ncbi:tail length tape measure protein [Citrobacter phage vB_CfrS_K1M]
MAEEVGGIVYEVGMDVQGLKSGATQVDASLSGLQKEFDKTSKQAATLDTSLTRTASSVQQASKGFGSFKSVMQQSGYQIQDFIVQVQGGQSALVAFSQQGSQLAGAFGPGGAVVGALIALGSVLAGVLMSALGNTADEMKTLQTAAENLNKVVVINSQGVAALSNDFARLAATNATLAAQLRDNAIQQYETAVKDAGKAVQSIVKDQTSWIHSITGGAASVNAMGDALSALDIKTNDYNEALTQSRAAGEVFVQVTKTIAATTQFLSSEFEISQQKAFELGNRLNDLAKNPSPEAISSLVDFLHTLKPATEDGAKAIQELETKVINAGVAMQQAKDNADSLKQSLDQLKTEAQQANFDNISKQLETQRIALSKGKQAAIEYGISQQDLTQAQKDELIAASRVVASLEEQKKKQDEAARAAKSHSTAVDGVEQKLEALRQKSMLAAQNTQALSREQTILNAQLSLGKTATEEQKKLAGEYAAQAFDTAAALKAQQKAEKEKQDTEKDYSAIRKQASPVSGLDSQFQEQMASLNAYAQLYPQKIAEVEQTRANIEAQYREQRMAAMWDEWSQQNAATMAAAAAFDSLGSTASNALTGILTGSMSVSDAMRNIGMTVLNSVINTFVQMGIEWVKSAIMGQAAQTAAIGTVTAVQTAAVGTQTAVSTAAAATTAAAWTPAAILSSIASMGTAAAIGLGAVAGVIGTSLLGKRKNGGPVAAGGMYQVGEGNAPEIFQASTGRQYMIAGDGGKVISNKDIMAGSGGGGGLIINNNVYNNSSGATATTSARDNGDGSITIETFISDMDEGGPMSSSMLRNFTMNRRATE